MWSNPDAHWDGFEPVRYLLHQKKVLDLPLTKVNKCGASTNETVQTTIGEVLHETAIGQIKTDETGFGFNVGSHGLSGVHFACELLKTLVDLRSKEVNLFAATWFWYAKADVRDDPHTSYAFFVVHDNKIVSERAIFHDAPDYGFDPDVFDAVDTSENWTDDKGWEDAEKRFWYRKFYRETMTGQLMVLRSDEPDLFHYPEGALVRRLFPQSGDPDFLAKLQAALSALAGRE